jgi:hypothetical protein
MLEKVGGEYQGACTFLIHDNGLRAGNNRVCFSPDGTALYVGQTMRGWGGPVEGLQRIIYTGKPALEVKEIHLKPDGFELSFTEPVEPTVGADAARYHVQHYYYPYSQQYGSPQTETTPVATQKVVLSDDGRTARVTLGEMKAGCIYQLDLVGLTSAAGRLLVHPTVCYTLNRLAK